MIRRARTTVRLACLAAAAFASIASIAAADVTLGSLFNDHMVLQRDHVNPLWGTADANAEVTVSVDGQVVDKTKANDKGEFKLKLPARPADGAPHAILVRSGGDFVAVGDVLIGDVWVCSGQSNMQWTLENTRDGAKEIAQATLPNVRLYYVPRVGAAEPVKTVDAKWTLCEPDTAKGFSSVAYFFGKHLNNELNIPIGLIHTSWGGTPAEAWTPLPAMEKLTDLPMASRQVARRAKGDTPEERAKYVEELKVWLKATNRDDQVIKPDAAGWEKVEVADASEWKLMAIPNDFAKQGVPNGCVWFRKEIDVPADAAGKPLVLSLGRIDEYDMTFFNGEKVGEIGPLSEESWSVARKYTVPGDKVKAGKNVIAVRVFDTGVVAGLIGPAASMTAKPEDGAAIPLAGEWMYRQESVFKPIEGKEPPRPAMPMKPDDRLTPAALYNGMIAPLQDYGIKGAIWYQGEANADRFQEYKKLLSTMIGSWRDQFGQGDFPFYVVGLANFMAPTEDPNIPSEWAGLREAQRQVGRDVKNAAMTVTIDIGEEKDIHPRNKQDVGKRLALVALEDTYGKKLVSRGPTVDDVEWKDGQVVIEFKNIGGGLKSIQEPLESFAIAGEDGKWFWADAKIDEDGDEVILSSPNVKSPAKVRYAWADNPKATLFNAEGLPAEPFEASK
jgi:sialate O-acetylesterase